MCAGRAKSLSVHIEEKMIEKGVRRTGAMYIGPDDDEEYRHDLLGYLEHREALKQVERFSLVINQLLVQPKANKSTTVSPLLFQWYSIIGIITKGSNRTQPSPRSPLLISTILVGLLLLRCTLPRPLYQTSSTSPSSKPSFSAFNTAVA